MEVRIKEGNDIQIESFHMRERTHFPIDKTASTTPRTTLHSGFFSAGGKAFSFQFIVRKIRHFVSCEERDSISYVNRVVVFLFRISEAFPFLISSRFAKDKIAKERTFFSCFVPFIAVSFVIHERMNYT